MLSGIYAAQFMSNQNIVGRGVVVFNGAVLHGGDDSYYYKGKYRLDMNNYVSAEVEVANYTGELTSIFGPLKQFRLTLNGTVNQDCFSLSGQVKGQPQLMISIQRRKVDDLIEA